MPTALVKGKVDAVYNTSLNKRAHTVSLHIHLFLLLWLHPDAQNPQGVGWRGGGMFLYTLRHEGCKLARLLAQLVGIQQLVCRYRRAVNANDALQHLLTIFQLVVTTSCPTTGIQKAQNPPSAITPVR
jgi:hypothetical protein